MANLRAILSECRPFVAYIADGFRDVPDGLDPTFYHTLSADGDRAEGEKLDGLLARIDTGLERDSEWQAIDTAPFSGPPVLLYRTGEMFTAMRISGEHGPGWCTPDGYQIFNPSHWMPLPEPPLVQQDSEK